jgi:hypothetical protein
MGVGIQEKEGNWERTEKRTGKREVWEELKTMNKMKHILFIVIDAVI